MVAQETFVANGAESTLSSALSAGATTINVTSTAAFPSVPFYAVIDPDVDATREVILVDSSKTATTFVLSGASKRGQDGTTDAAHSAGAKVVCVPVAALWTDINDRVDAANTALTSHASDTTDVHGIADTSALLDTSDIGVTVQGYSAALAGTTASFTTAKDSKLTGIETGADVTDAANVAAAGAVMESDTTTAAMGFVVDEDDMASNSATKVPTQQSVKTYVDANTGAGGGASVVKSANESVTSSTTLQDDNHLVLPVEASKTYRFRGMVMLRGDSTPSFKMGWTVPSGATLGEWGAIGGGAPINAGAAATGTITFTGPGASMSAPIFFEGILTVGATPGNLQLQWAQSVSSGSSVTVRAGSVLSIEEI